MCTTNKSVYVQLIVWTEAVILTRNYILTRSSMKRSNVGVLLFCGGCPRYAASTFAFLRRSTEADATRLSIINRKSGKRSLQRTAARRCPRMPAEDWSWIRKIAIRHKKKKTAICQVCSLHLRGMQHFTFRLFPHRSDSLHWLHQQKRKVRHLQIGGVLQARHQNWWLVCAPS